LLICWFDKSDVDIFSEKINFTLEKHIFPILLTPKTPTQNKIIGMMNPSLFLQLCTKLNYTHTHTHTQINK
jgi:hypothetical protein